VDVLADLFEKNSTSGRINANSALTVEFNTPHIFSLSQISTHEGDELTLFGDNFGSNQGSGIVQFYPDLMAEVISWSDSVIVCKVPNGAQSGEVKVTTAEGISNSIEITVLIKYYEETLIDNEFLGEGQARGWQADDQSWLYQLPFSFPFFGQQYDSVYVCSNGFLDFTNSSASYLNSIEVFKNRVMIAPLWDDLITTGSSQQGENIYIHYPSSDSVSIRWVAERYETRDPVNVEVVLYEDGRIQFNYGSGNTNLSSTTGLSGGEGNMYHLSFHDGDTQLNQVQTVLFSPHEQSFTITLNKGWNLISLPLEPEIKTTSRVLSSAGSGIESVWGYTDGAWQVHLPENSQISDLETMKTGCGYWIKANQDDLEIQIQGEIRTTPLQMATGWNLIGFNSLQSRPMEETLESIGGNFEIVWGYKDGVWLLYDLKSSGFSDLTEMEPGRGYWIKSQ